MKNSTHRVSRLRPGRIVALGIGCVLVGTAAFAASGTGSMALGKPGPVSEIPQLGGATAARPPLVFFAGGRFTVVEGNDRFIIVRMSRPLRSEDPDRVTVDLSFETRFAEPGKDYVDQPVQTLVFEKGGPNVLILPFETLQDEKFEGSEFLIARLTNPVGADPGPLMQVQVEIVDDDPFDPTLLDDFEQPPYLWETGAGSLDHPEFAADDPLAVPGQGAFERVLEASFPLQVEIDAPGRICNRGDGVVPVVLKTTDTFDATRVDHGSVTLGDAREAHVDRKTGLPKRHVEDADGDGDLDLVFHFRYAETGLPCAPESLPFRGRTGEGRAFTAEPVEAAFRRDFAMGRDWMSYDGLEFRYYGTGSGNPVVVDLLDNRAPDPGPAGWQLVWSEEFDEPAGTPPDPANWAYEIGDGAFNGLTGWGNRERQYYTDDVDNVSTDGEGNLVITAREADGSRQCFYGTCEYTSARLIGLGRKEFAFGRIEARVRLPDGEAGLWPAFWSLGTDIVQVGWPQTGEIDIMEYVSRSPTEIFGTIHGPGYSGSDSYSGIVDISPDRVSEDWRTFAIEWEPGHIAWSFDDVVYHTASPADLSPLEWVFDKPQFLILNLAVGGFFGGEVSPDLTFPQELKIDYVRVYQAPDTAERWEASFVDDFEGWREIEIPFADFTRGDAQPDGAPDDGLGLEDVWGYGFRLPEGSATGRVLLDGVRLTSRDGTTGVSAPSP